MWRVESQYHNIRGPVWSSALACRVISLRGYEVGRARPACRNALWCLRHPNPAPPLQAIGIPSGRAFHHRACSREILSSAGPHASGSAEIREHKYPTPYRFVVHSIPIWCRGQEVTSPLLTSSPRWWHAHRRNPKMPRMLLDRRRDQPSRAPPWPQTANSSPSPSIGSLGKQCAESSSWPSKRTNPGPGSAASAAGISGWTTIRNSKPRSGPCGTEYLTS